MAELTMDVKKKLVELLSADVCEHDCCDDCECAKNIDACIDYLKERTADRLIANGVTVQEWVKVEDRLPKEWEHVLVWSKFGFQETAVWIGTPGKWRVTWNGDMLEENSVTHWMPLPEPPKEECPVTEQTKAALEKMGRDAHGGNDGG